MVAFSADKRTFFRKMAKGGGDLIRPPWSVEEYLFVELCRNCNACVEACPETIIQFDSRKQPFLNFHSGECTFCADCVTVCDTGALHKTHPDAQPWDTSVSLKQGCLSEQNTLCRSCGEVCQYDALHFPRNMTAITKPEIDTEQCIGCGACVSICPTEALDVQYHYSNKSIKNYA